MASITKTDTGYLAQVRRGGVSKSKRFSRKTDATMWAAKIESDIDAHARGDLPNYTLLEAIDRYIAEIVPQHRSWRANLSSLNIAKRSCLPLNRPLHSVTSADLAEWRDWRSKQVSDGSVNRELAILKLVFSVALNEWGWIRENPSLTVRKKLQPKHRDRLVSDAERESIIKELAGKPFGKLFQTRVAFEFALETGMRLGETMGLKPENVQGRVAHLALTKNGTSRNVPLSKRALALLAEIEHDGIYFTARPNAISFVFGQAVKRAGIENLRFHDTRHAAITALAKKLTVLELARSIGHRDLKSLMIYYNETAENLADKLD